MTPNPSRNGWHAQAPAVLSCDSNILDRLEQLGVRVPDNFGLACPSLSSDKTRLAGVVENGVRMGSVAVDYLVSMIHRGERGVPTTAERILVEGSWHEGESLKPGGVASAS
jgi:hypothetical protein